MDILQFLANFFNANWKAIISSAISTLSVGIIIINIKAITNQNKTAIRNATNERFKNAIDQLGNKENTVVLGAIYTLHRIAKEDESYRENVFNILCSYVRDTTTTTAYQDKYKEKPSEPIQTILNILCVNKEDREVYRVKKIVNGKEEYIKLVIDFSGCYFGGVNLYNGDLSHSNLEKIIFCKNSKLDKANLKYSNLKHLSISDSNSFSINFSFSKLNDITISNSNLSFSNFNYVDLSGANLSRVDLWEANIKGACLYYANFKNCYLSKSNLKCSYLYKTNFEESNLKKTNLVGVCSQDLNIFELDFY